MPTKVITLSDKAGYTESVKRAARLIRDGKLVGFPTETVYGVAARADNADADAALRRLKDREAGKPFTVHIGRPDDVHRFVPSMSTIAKRLVQKGWPGPLSLVFPVEDPAWAPVLRDAATTGGASIDASLVFHEGTVGIRCPANQAARDLLTEAAVPVVAASANRAGQPPPHSAAGVIAGLPDALALVLDGGPTQYAQSSTVVAVTDSSYRILREGALDARTVERMACLNLLFVCTGNTCRSPMAQALCMRIIAQRLNCSVGDLPDRHVCVLSAGVYGMDGSRASAEAQRVMADRGVDLSAFRSQGLNRALIERADRIYCMTRSHVEAVLLSVPSAVEKTSLLGGDTQIEDPIGGPVESYESCARKLQTALESRLTEIEL